MFYSAAPQGGDPSAGRAQRHYVVWHLGACCGVQKPQWCRWVNWFSALWSTIRLEYREEKDECCRILLQFADFKGCVNTLEGFVGIFMEDLASKSPLFFFFVSTCCNLF